MFLVMVRNAGQNAFVQLAPIVFNHLMIPKLKKFTQSPAGIEIEQMVFNTGPRLSITTSICVA
jgi:hypothetical protein